MGFPLAFFLFVIRFAAGLDFMEDNKLTNDTSNFTLTVHIDTRAKLIDMIFTKKVEYIEVSVYIEDTILDTFLKQNNVTVNSTIAMPPYYKFVWVDEAGMNIHQMDYRFKMWSLGTLIPSVHTIDFMLLTSDIECFKKLGITEMFEQIQDIFRRTVYQNNSTSNPVMDYSYLCHRYERYTNSEKCLASKCFMFNEHHYFNRHDGFCSDNVNKLIYVQIWIWMILFLMFLNNLPLLVFWLQGEPDENPSNAVNQGNPDYTQLQEMQNPRTSHDLNPVPDAVVSDSVSKSNNPEKRVRLFFVSESNCKHYPWMGRWCYHLFSNERWYFIVFRWACFYICFCCFTFGGFL